MCLRSLRNNLGWFCLPVLGFCALCVIGAGRCAATDEPSGGSLEDYLKRMGYEAVEFERNDHVQPFVEGILSNGHKRRFLVDTCWGISTLDENAARGLKRVNELEAVLEDSILGSVTNHEFVVMDKLVIGRTQFLNQPARVEQLRAEFITLPYNGVLGYDFLLRNFCLIDCWKHRMYVRSGKLSGEQLKAFDGTLRLSGFTEIPLESGYLLSVKAEINGQPILLGVDTGRAFEELDDSQLKPLGLVLLKNTRAATGSLIQQDVTSDVIGLGTIGKQKIHVTKLDSFGMGPRKWKNIYFAVVDLKPWNLAKPGTRAEAIKGLLSQSILGRHGALIDVANRKLWLRQEGQPAR
jgi:hypothetical protein